MYFVAVFLLVLVFNIIPFFMPSTWSVLTFFSVRHDNLNLILLIIIGALAATLGRLILAKFSRSVIRQHYLSQTTKHNIDALKTYLGKERGLLFLVIFFFALTPVPSNQLFIAYGLADLPLKNAAAPFFLGRVISYFAIIKTIQKALNLYAPDIQSADFFWYFVLMQAVTIGTVYIFTKINWRKIIPRFT